MPNISGSICCDDNTYEDIFDAAISTGPFGNLYDSFSRACNTNTPDFRTTYAGFDFNASRSSNVYQDNATVHPESLGACFYIRY